MVLKIEESKAEKLNKKIYRIIREITNDEEFYPEAKNMISKLKWISDQVIERITNELKIK